MMTITFPPPTIINKEAVDMLLMLDRYVFTQPIWREKAMLPFAQKIRRKLPAPRTGAVSVKITNDEHEALEKGMLMAGAQLTPDINPYYLDCLEAVYTAADSKDPVVAAPEAPATEAPPT